MLLNIYFLQVRSAIVRVRLYLSPMGVGMSWVTQVLLKSRADFAVVLSSGVLTEAMALREVWSVDGENFSGALTSAGGGDPYESAQQALNEVYNALFYLETTTKDRKLAQPMGLRDCIEDLCLDDIEGLESESAFRSITANLKGFRLLFTGGEGVGMSDLLIDVGHGDLATSIIADVDQTIALAEAFTLPLERALVEEYEEVQVFYDSLQLVTTALKVDLVTVFSLEVPSEAAGDND